jgi:hypothetical protein
MMSLLLRKHLNQNIQVRRLQLAALVIMYLRTPVQQNTLAQALFLRKLGLNAAGGAAGWSVGVRIDDALEQLLRPVRRQGLPWSDNMSEMLRKHLNQNIQVRWNTMVQLFCSYAVNPGPPLLQMYLAQGGLYAGGRAFVCWGCRGVMCSQSCCASTLTRTHRCAGCGLHSIYFELLRKHLNQNTPQHTVY